MPDDGRTYPLPPSLGAFPIYRTRDFPLLRNSASRADFFVPLYQWEALWVSFQAEDWRPNAVQIAAGGINVLSGEEFPSPLRSRPQNYVVCPLQPWLDGIRTQRGTVRQFVAAPLGEGLTVSEQVGGRTEGGLQIRVFEPLPGKFPDRKPRGHSSMAMFSEDLSSGELGLAGGGAIEQKIYPDPHGKSTWDPKNFSDIRILILNSMEFKSITGRVPPPSPISAADYEMYGLPWFKLYDEDLADIGGSSRLKRLKTVNRGDPSVAATHVKRINRGKKRKPS